MTSSESGAKRQATSVDVATESGVSQTTVSRVFAAPELVSPATQAKVHAAAQRLGYVPNAIARSLRSQRTNFIGAVVPSDGEYWQHAVTVFSRKLTAQGQQLVLFSLVEAEPVEQVLESIGRYRLDGVVLASAKIPRSDLLRVAERLRTNGNGVPVVAFNQPDAAGIVPSVSVDNEAGAAALAEHLIERGCRSALFVGGIASASTDRLRYQGAARAFGSHGIGCAYVEAGSFSYDAGYAIAERVAAQSPRPRAVMVAGDELAFGVLDGLRSVGVSVPAEVMLTGFDGLPQASWAGYDLTTTVQDIEVMVERSIELLIAPPAPGEPIPDVVAASSLRIGSTTGQAAGEQPSNGQRRQEREEDA